MSSRTARRCAASRSESAWRTTSSHSRWTRSRPTTRCVRIEAGGGALLFADSVVSYGGLRFVPDHLIGDDPEGVKAKIRERCRALLDEEFDHLLFAHGAPLIGGGRETLRAFAAPPD